MYAWAREGCMVAGCNFHLFNWTDDFDVQKESVTATQWLFLLGLPLIFYILDCFQVIAARFKKFLSTDNATIYKTRTTKARICVEVNLLEE